MTVYAAGTIPWRYNRETKNVEVLLVFRKRYADWSFPKGKLDANETLPQAAVRETREETGYPAKLGVNLGTLSYRLRGGEKKVVAYWAAKVTRRAAKKHRFRANAEIAQLAWVPLEQAPQQLSYARDREILEVFAQLVKSERHDTYAVLVLRHAQAEPRSADFPVDYKRPLTDRGCDESQLIVPVLSVFNPKGIISSDAKRCRATVTPLAHLLHVPLTTTAALSQDTWDTGDISRLRDTVAAAIAKQKSVVLCSHRPVLPEIAREIALSAGSRSGSYLQEAVQLPPAGFAVFHLTKKPKKRQLVSVESYPLKHAL